MDSDEETALAVVSLVLALKIKNKNKKADRLVEALASKKILFEMFRYTFKGTSI